MTMQITREEAISLNNFHKNIGANIHKFRIKHKITIEKLSKISGLKTKTIEKYEMGTQNMSFTVLLKLANILKVNITELLKS